MGSHPDLPRRNGHDAPDRTKPTTDARDGKAQATRGHAPRWGGGVCLGGDVEETTRAPLSIRVTFFMKFKTPPPCWVTRPHTSQCRQHQRRCNANRRAGITKTVKSSESRANTLRSRSPATTIYDSPHWPHILSSCTSHRVLGYAKPLPSPPAREDTQPWVRRSTIPRRHV